MPQRHVQPDTRAASGVTINATYFKGYDGNYYTHHPTGMIKCTGDEAAKAATQYEADEKRLASKRNMPKQYGLTTDGTWWVREGADLGEKSKWGQRDEEEIARAKAYLRRTMGELDALLGKHERLR